MVMQRGYDNSRDEEYYYDDGQPETAYEYGSSMVDDTGMYKNPTPAASVDNPFYSAGGYSPQQEAYLESLREAWTRLRAKYPGASINMPDFVNPTYDQPSEDPYSQYDTSTPRYAPGSEIDAAMASGKTADETVSNLGYNVRDFGQGTTNKGAYLTPGTKYWLVDNVTGQPLGSGSTPEELQALSSQANELSSSQGAKANWSIVTQGADTRTPTYGYTGEYDEDGNAIQSVTGYTSEPSYTTVASDFLDPKKKSGLGWLDYLLPAVGALLAPFTGGLSLGLGTLGNMAVTVGLGSALGSGVSSAVQGRPLGQALLRAGLSGVTAGVGSYVTPGISNALFGGVGEATAAEAAGAIARGLSSVLTPAELAAGQALIASGGYVANAGVNAATNVISMTAGEALAKGIEQVVVNGVFVPTATAIAAGGVGALVGTTIGSAIGSGGLGTLADPVAPTKSAEEVTVTNEKPDTTFTPDVGSGGLETLVDPVDPIKSADEVTVTDEKPKTIEEILDTVYPGAGSTLPDIGDSVTVEGHKTPTQDQIDAGDIAAKAAVDAAAKTAADAATADPAKKEPSTLDKVDDYLTYGKLGLTLLGLLGGAGAGGKGTGATGTVPGGSGEVPERFKTDKLPTGDDIPRFGGGTFRKARDMGNEDYNRYGFGPEKSFFETVPAPAKTTAPTLPQVPGDGLIAPGTGDATLSVMDEWINDKTGEKFTANNGSYSATPGSGWRRAAKGGSMAVRRPSKSFAVRGAGDGRSDDIPAVLSDGEYVMDAETVALLGNGSNKAGAAQLDRFRANVRKHKGKDLAKGRFSANAKNLQAYMAGGRS